MDSLFEGDGGTVYINYLFPEQGIPLNYIGLHHSLIHLAFVISILQELG